MEIIKEIGNLETVGIVFLVILLAVICFLFNSVFEIIKYFKKNDLELSCHKINSSERIEKFKFDQSLEITRIKADCRAIDEEREDLSEQLEEIQGENKRLKKSVDRLIFISDPANEAQVTEIIDDIYDRFSQDLWKNYYY